MKPLRILGLLATVCFAGALSAQDGLQKGTIKKVDADKNALIIAVEGKDVTLQVKPDTRVMDASGKQYEEPFKDKAFTVGAAVVFKTDPNDDGVLVGIRVDTGGKNTDGGIQRAKIIKLDLDKMIITFQVAGKELDFRMTEETRVLNAQGDSLKEKLQGFKAGAEIQFVARPKEDKNYLVAIKLFDGAGKEPGKKGPLPKVDSSKLVPLNELKGEYNGLKGGFYPDGANERPKEHEAAGLRLAKELQPLNAAGKPDPQGKIVMLSVGMSNTSQASQGFAKVLASAEGVNPRFQFINGAQGGMTAARIQNPENADGTKYWTTVDQMLKKAGSAREQVQVIWIKQADAGPSQGFPAYAKKLEEELTKIVQILPGRFPNVKMVYLSSRTYGGYATTGLNPEPYAYESGFSVKWLIERQITGEVALNFDPKKGEVKAPWLSWGPYLWANGAKKRPDGFSYDVSDFAGDGTHHSAAGMEKVGRQMLRFFETDSTTRLWFSMAK